MLKCIDGLIDHMKRRVDDDILDNLKNIYTKHI